MSETYLDKAYGDRDSGGIRKLYDDWALSYDAEIAENGYATPARCARALRTYISDLSKPILDFGCGTGLSGAALRLAGFKCIDGIDLSAKMLAQAQSKHIYRSLSRIKAGAPLSHAPGDYAAIAAIGVISAGAAPISVFDTLVRGLGSGGLMVFSFNDHALADDCHEKKLNDHLDSGKISLRFEDYGDHLPGINLKSKVYVVEKL